MTRLVSAGLVVVVAAFAATTAAAGQDHEARFTIGGGAGVSDPFHGDFDFHAAGWEVVARGRPAAHLTVEAFASMWRHTTETRRIGLPLQGPNGVIGTVGELLEQRRDQTQAFGVSLLPTLSAGRATFVVGGGANVMFFQHRFEQELRDCVSTTAITCGPSSSAHTASDLGAHAVAGIDVRVRPRVAAFGQYRILVPVRDPGSGHAAWLAGVRIALR